MSRLGRVRERRKCELCEKSCELERLCYARYEDLFGGHCGDCTVCWTCCENLPANVITSEGVAYQLLVRPI